MTEISQHSVSCEELSWENIVQTFWLAHDLLPLFPMIYVSFSFVVSLSKSFPLYSQKKPKATMHQDVCAYTCMLLPHACTDTFSVTNINIQHSYSSEVPCFASKLPALRPTTSIIKSRHITSGFSSNIRGEYLQTLDIDQRYFLNSAAL